ncbi:MAG: DEAD/DEAH box helicase [Caldilineales bacterium]
MPILHGAWLPSTYPPSLGGAFAVWSEVAPGPPAKKRGGRPPKVSPHPFAGDVDALEQVLRGVAGKAAPLLVDLPSRSGRPLASPMLLAEEADDGEISLATWQVSACLLAPEDALRWLASLPERDRLSPQIVLGDDIRFWQHAACWQLSLLARQRFVPTLLPSDAPGAPQTTWRAAWQPSLDDPADRARLEQLAAAMPPVCRALRLPDDASKPHGPARLLTSFLHTVTDACVRGWAAPSLAMIARAPVRPELRWRRALLRADPAVPGSANDLALLAGQVNEWLAQLRSDGDAAFRLCFRLEPPEEPAVDRDERAWQLRYLLQAADDLSLLVPAELVWRARGQKLRYLDRRFDQPQERMLAGLGKASRLFAPIEESLHAARPEAAVLTTDEAYTFLRETALLLEESGFGVLAPQWWGRRGASNRLGARLTLQATQQKPPSGGVGGMSFARIVSVDWSLALGDETLTLKELERLARLKQPLVRIRGRWAVLDPEQVESAIKFWETRQATAGELSLQEALRMLLGAQEQLAGLDVVGVSADGWLARLVDELQTAGGQMAVLPQPAAFSGQLRPYQQRGFSWLAFLRRWGLGACLADDMGLGKTAETIAYLLEARSPGASAGARPNPALVICPTSVVGNWQREIQRFAPSLRVMVHHGGDRRRGEEFAEAARGHDVVISTYALARRDADMMLTIDWGDVILDEAQNIKNPGAKQTQTIRKLPAEYRIALTGTPVENRLNELWSIMHFLNPGYLGSQRDFQRQFARPIEKAGDEDAARRLRSLTQPFILRRLKTDPTIIQDLPDKLEMTTYCTLTAEQATLYQAVVKDSLQQVEVSEGIGRRGLVLATLLKLKQVCNHPAQFLADGSPALLAGPDGPEHRSGKLARLNEMLEEALAEGDRALIFTQFAEMGGLLKGQLQEAFGQEVLFLHGGTPLARRDEMVARFQSGRGPALFILSLKAGGTGLNLTAANHVFHFDRWWNPAVENQATDRAFRIGQARNVHVHKLVCAGTLEETIDDLIERKKALADAVVGAGEGWLTELSTDDLRQLLTLRQDAAG